MGRADLLPEQVAALVCREMKWTWEDYANQPAWFIKVVLGMIQHEIEEANRRSKQAA